MTLSMEPFTSCPLSLSLKILKREGKKNWSIHPLLLQINSAASFRTIGTIFSSLRSKIQLCYLFCYLTLSLWFNCLLFLLVFQLILDVLHGMKWIFELAKVWCSHNVCHWFFKQWEVVWVGVWGGFGASTVCD